MKIDILTIFPEMFAGPLDVSIIGRARSRGLLQIEIHNIRDWAAGRHRITDDIPYGGGVGMVMKPEPVFAAVEAVRCPPEAGCSERIILLDPQGCRLDQEKLEELSRQQHLVLICGHYEGVDERIRQHLVTDEISIGDYVLTGGELPAMVLVDGIGRLLPGVLERPEATRAESFAGGLFDYPQYTRPAEFRGWGVPAVLLSGHHQQIEGWRHEQALKRTMCRRPDLLERVGLSEKDRQLLRRIREEGACDVSEHADSRTGE